MINNENIYAALFSLLETLVGNPLSTAQPLVSASRRMDSFTNVAAAQMPCLFQVQREDDADWKFGRPAKWTLSADLFIYVPISADKTIIPSQVYNPIVFAIRSLLVPAGDVTQTLGGLVNRCSMEGKTQYWDGVLDNVAIVALPVQMIAA